MKHPMVSMLHFPEFPLHLLGIMPHVEPSRAYLFQWHHRNRFSSCFSTSIHCTGPLNIFKTFTKINKLRRASTTVLLIYSPFNRCSQAVLQDQHKITSRLVTGCSTSSYHLSSCYGRFDMKLNQI